METGVMIGNHHFVSRKRLEEIVLKDKTLCLLGSAENGKEMYRQLRLRHPQVVLLHPVMPGMDSIHIIESAANDRNLKDIKFLLIGNAGARKVMEFLTARNNTAFIDSKSSDEIILTAIHAALDGEKRTLQKVSEFKRLDKNTKEDMQVLITEFMRGLGIPAHIKGYMYLRSAILEAAEDASVLNGITKQLYPKIATMYDTTASRVERAIRHAISLAYEREPERLREMLYGDMISEQESYRPTNSEFIALVADKLRINKSIA